jgi:hypothetical protein
LSGVVGLSEGDEYRRFLEEFGDATGDDADDSGVPFVMGEDERGLFEPFGVEFDEFLGLLEDSASLRARSGFSVVRSSTARRACPRRPTALRRGPTAKPMSSAWISGLSQTPATCSKAFMPSEQRSRRLPRPYLTMMRFSPVRGTTSAMVPRAAKLMALRFFAECPSQLEGDTDASQIAEGIVAVGESGVNQEGIGELGGELVMVADDEFHAEFASEGGFIDAGDAAIDGEEEPRRVFLGERADGVRIESVAFVHPIRDVVVDLRTGEFQAVPEEAGGGNAVDIVVAVDGNAAFLFDGGEKPVDSLGNAGKEFRFVEIGQFGGEECLGGGFVFVASSAEDLSQDR